MIRGRRGVVWVILLVLFFARALQVHAAELSVTATVPLTPLWRTAIETESTFAADCTSHRNLCVVRTQIRGLQATPLPHQSLELIVLKEGRLYRYETLTTDEEGTGVFTFVYTQPGVYRMLLVNRTFEAPFVVRARTELR